MNTLCMKTNCRGLLDLLIFGCYFCIILIVYQANDNFIIMKYIKLADFHELLLCPAYIMYNVFRLAINHKAIVYD